MGFYLTIDREEGLAKATFSGECERRGAWAGIAAIRDIVLSEAIDGVVIDLRQVACALGPDDVDKFAVEFLTFLGRRRLALVTRRRQHTEVATNMATVVARHGLEMQVFDNPESASRWLNTRDERL